MCLYIVHAKYRPSLHVLYCLVMHCILLITKRQRHLTTSENLLTLGQAKCLEESTDPPNKKLDHLSSTSWFILMHDDCPPYKYVYRYFHVIYYNSCVCIFLYHLHLYTLNYNNLLSFKWFWILHPKEPTGVITLQLQTLHYYRGISSK